MRPSFLAIFSTDRKSTRAAMLVVSSSWPAETQPLRPPCEPRAKVLEWAATNFKEVSVSLGIAGLSVLEILAAPDGRTWTAIVTDSHGCSRVIAVGVDWQQIAPLQGQPLRWPAAHGDDWISRAYPECCSVSSGDCFPITTSHWDFDGVGSYRVRWYGIERWIPELEAKPSMDGVAYVCEAPSHAINCFIVPKAGT